MNQARIETVEACPNLVKPRLKRLQALISLEESRSERPEHGAEGKLDLGAYETYRDEPGFHEITASLYSLYPSLVHVRLLSGYVPGIEGVLGRLGL